MGTASNGRGRKGRRKRKLPTGVRRLEKGGRDRYRATCTVDGRRIVGTLRDDPNTAHRDYLRLIEERDRPPRVVTTLEDGLAAAMAHKRAQGVAKERSLAASRTVCRVLLEAWRHDAPLSDVITADQINWYIKAAQGRGRDLRTIKEKDLPMLKLAAKKGGIEWPIGIRPIRLPKKARKFFDPDELVELVERVRNEPIRWKSGRNKGKLRDFPARERAADIVEVFACTGIRAAEFARMVVGDIDLRRRAIVVGNAKDVGNEDLISLPKTLDGPVRRLIAGADERGRIMPGGEPSLSTLFERWQQRLEEPRLCGRTLRHSFLTMVQFDTGDLAATREAGRHASLKTTSIYVHLVESLRAKRSAAIEARFARPRNQGS